MSFFFVDRYYTDLNGNKLRDMVKFIGNKKFSYTEIFYCGEWEHFSGLYKDIIYDIVKGGDFVVKKDKGNDMVYLTNEQQEVFLRIIKLMGVKQLESLRDYLNDRIDYLIDKGLLKVNYNDMLKQQKYFVSKLNE